MKAILQKLLWLCVAFTATKKVFSQANTALSNLSVTAINTSLLPSADNSLNLGSAAKGWKIAYVNSAIYMGGAKFINFGSSVTARNTAVGYNALNLNSSGTVNTAYGASALQNNSTGFGNVALGYSALYGNTTGSSNIAIGIRSLNDNVSGRSLIGIGDSSLLHQNGGSGFNIAIGAKALYSNTTGDHNTAIGSGSFYSNTTGRNNVGIGSSALYNNTGGSENNAFGHGTLLLNTTGGSNVAIGAFAMNNNSTGSSNIAIGSRALNASKSASQNIAIGDSALYSSTAGVSQSVAIGSKALYATTTGKQNTAVGWQAMANSTITTGSTVMGYQAANSNTSGDQNTAVGALALQLNTTGGNNVAVGYSSLGRSNGSGNTAIGFGAFYSNLAGVQNTGVGFLCGLAADNLTNATAIGYEAFATGSQTVTLGGSSVTTINGYVGFTQVSDGRFKKEVKENVPGMEFIKELRPVTYHYDVHGINNHIRPAGSAGEGYKKDPSLLAIDEKAMSDKEKRLYTGFIAQEVETAAEKFNYEFSAVHKPDNDRDTYGLSYADFVAPVVKALQEVNAAKDSLKASNDSLHQRVDSLEARLERIEQMLKAPNAAGVSLSDAQLMQNIPNPFVAKTQIPYFLPAKFGRAKMTITDMSGKILKSIALSGTGRGSLSLESSALAAGIYNYSLYVDENLIGTRQTALSK